MMMVAPLSLRGTFEREMARSRGCYGTIASKKTIVIVPLACMCPSSPVTNVICGFDGVFLDSKHAMVWSEMILCFGLPSISEMKQNCHMSYS